MDDTGPAKQPSNSAKKYSEGDPFMKGGVNAVFRLDGAVYSIGTRRFYSPAFVSYSAERARKTFQTNYVYIRTIVVRDDSMEIRGHIKSKSLVFSRPKVRDVYR